MGSGLNQPVDTTANSLKVIQVKKIGTFLYQVKTQGEGYLTLSQGYDVNWLAFSTSNLLNFYPHFQYNGWANAWKIPTGEHSLVIFYWPQLLGFAGYGLLAFTGLFFMTAVIKNKFN